MATSANDLIINNSIIRDLSREEGDVVTQILDSFLVPHLWSKDFGGSTATENDADVHFLTGELGTRIKGYVEQAIGKNFQLIIDKEELDEVKRAQEKLSETSGDHERI